MKTLILAMFVVAIAAFDHDLSSLLKYLNDIKGSKEYQMLSQDDKKCFQDLITAAQTGPSDLNTFINNYSFVKILILADHLDDDDIPHFEALLAYYADPTNFPGTRKRQDIDNADLCNWLQEMRLIYKIEEDMDKDVKEMFALMMFHLEHDTLTQYINQVGYAKVFKVLSEIDNSYSHKIDRMLVYQLQKEAAMAGGSTIVMPACMGMPVSTVIPVSTPTPVSTVIPVSTPTPASTAMPPSTAMPVSTTMPFATTV